MINMYEELNVGDQVKIVLPARYSKKRKKQDIHISDEMYELNGKVLTIRESKSTLSEILVFILDGGDPWVWLPEWLEKVTVKYNDLIKCKEGV